MSYKYALKSSNQRNAFINRNFIIRVLENPKENPVKNTRLTSANKLSNFINNKVLENKLFNTVLDRVKDKYAFLIETS
jgi:hypothetical protein